MYPLPMTVSRNISSVLCINMHPTLMHYNVPQVYSNDDWLDSVCTQFEVLLK